MSTTAIRVTDDSTREQIAAAIAVLRVKAERMPAYWVDRRREIADECDVLVDMWLAARA